MAGEGEEAQVVEPKEAGNIEDLRNLEEGELSNALFNPDAGGGGGGEETEEEKETRLAAEKEALENETEEEKDERLAAAALENETEEEKAERLATEEVLKNETKEEKEARLSTEAAEKEAAAQNEENPEYYASLSESSGFEITSQEDLDGLLTYAMELHDKAKNPDKAETPSYSKEIQTLIDIEKGGGNISTAMNAMSKDYTGMADKDILFEKFMLDSKDGSLVSNPEFARMKFEQEYNSKYGLLDKLESTDELEREEFLKENKAQIEFHQKSLEHDAKNARAELGEWKENSTSATVDRGGYTEEERAVALEKYHADIDNVIDRYDGIDLLLNDNAKDNFHLKLPGDKMPLLKETLINPVEWFNEVLGVELQAGNVLDPSKLSDAFTVMESLDNLSSLLGPHYMEMNDKKTIEEQMHNPRKKQVVTGQGKSQDLQGEIADKFREQRMDDSNWK